VARASSSYNAFATATFSSLHCASYNTCKGRWRITSNGDDSNDNNDNDNEHDNGNNKNINKIIVIIVV